MSAYYNEFDPFAAQWLKNLIAAGHIAPGEVDERSIVSVQPDDLVGFSQCHFFAGIGGWSLALRLAEWPDDKSVWTGSCPCQPFSTAGKGRAEKDERHLWPEFRRLISECSPSVVFGEQVAAKAGRDWLAAVRADLEALGYAVGAADLCAAGVGAPHIRQRLWFVADANRERRDRIDPLLRGETTRRGTTDFSETAGGGIAGLMADANMPDAARQRFVGLQVEPEQKASGPRAVDAWADAIFIECADGKARPTQPGLFPLAHGVSGRVGRLRGYGNAIVPQIAQAFIEAVMECQP